VNFEAAKVLVSKHKSLANPFIANRGEMEKHNFLKKWKKNAKKPVLRLRYTSYMIIVDAGVSILEHMSALAS
jgi:hypothetical protein